MPKKRDYRFTPRGRKQYKAAVRQISQAIEEGSLEGSLQSGSKFQLLVSPEMESGTIASVQTYYWGGHRRTPFYQVEVQPKYLGSRAVVGHEAGHLLAGKMDDYMCSSEYMERYDFEGYVKNELEADWLGRSKYGGRSKFYRDLTLQVRLGVEYFGYDYPSSFEVVKDVAKEMNIPFKHVKAAERELVRLGKLSK